jgi:hypothetical protein
MSFPKSPETQESIDNILEAIEHNQAIVNHADGDTLGVLCEFILVGEEDDCFIFTVNGLHKCEVSDDYYSAALLFEDETISNQDYFSHLKDTIIDMIYDWEDYEGAQELVEAIEECENVAMNMICYWIYDDYREFLLKLNSYDDKLAAMTMIESDFSDQILYDFFDDSKGLMH